MSATTWLKRPAGAWGISLVLLTTVGVGCGERTSVSGTVSYLGRPLPDGTVLLLASDGQAYHGQIGPDGRFAIPDVPRGEARVAVSSLVEGPGSGGAGAAGGHGRIGLHAPTYSRIPMRYSDLSVSSLTATIADDTALDLDLK